MYSAGELHSTGSRSSSVHMNFTPAWSLLNVKLACVSSVCESAFISGVTESIVVFGGSVTVHE